jgi:hypothetical protein
MHLCREVLECQEHKTILVLQGHLGFQMYCEMRMMKLLHAFHFQALILNNQHNLQVVRQLHKDLHSEQVCLGQRQDKEDLLTGLLKVT